MDLALLALLVVLSTYDNQSTELRKNMILP